MKILIFSDSHGSLRDMENAIEEHSPNQVFFLGDVHDDCESISRFYPYLSICEVYGNNDYAPPSMLEKEITLSGIKFFVTHGHKYGVKNGLDALAYSAKAKNCRVALYGHTHIQAVEKINGVLCVNPGAIWFGKYLICEIENGRIISLKSDRNEKYEID